jgi:hypothetical protein
MNHLDEGRSWRLGLCLVELASRVATGDPIATVIDVMEIGGGAGEVGQGHLRGLLLDPDPPIVYPSQTVLRDIPDYHPIDWIPHPRSLLHLSSNPLKSF